MCGLFFIDIDKILSISIDKCHNMYYHKRYCKLITIISINKRRDAGYWSVKILILEVSMKRFIMSCLIIVLLFSNVIYAAPINESMNNYKVTAAEVLDGDNSFYNVNESHKDSQNMRVFVTVKKGKRNEVLENICEMNIDLDVRHEFNDILYGFSATINSKDLSIIEELPFVDSIRIANTYKKQISESKKIINVPASVSVHDAVYNQVYNPNPPSVMDLYGDEMMIAVLDTGIYIDHSNLELPSEATPKFTKEEVESKLTESGTKGKYYTPKVPIGFDFADNDDDIYMDIYGDMMDGHGTHIAGIAAGSSQLSDGLEGIAPHAQIMGLKVFSNEDHHNAYEDDIVAAIMYAIEWDVDVINLSFGQLSGFDDEDAPEHMAIKAAVDKGIIVASAAGNGGYSTMAAGKPLSINPDIGTVEKPGVYKDTIQVASMSNTEITGPLKYYSEDGEVEEVVEYQEQINDTQTNIPDIIETLGGGVFDVVYVGDGQPGYYEEIDVTGKIVFAHRTGDYFYRDIQKTAEEHGAVALIVLRHPDHKENMVIKLNNPKIPVVCLLKDAGEKLLKYIYNHNKDLKMQVGKTSIANKNKYKMAYDSSYGISSDLEIKPDITAPGEHIWSLVGQNKYESMSGTSMATPHVAGGSILLSQYLQHGRKLEKNRDFVEEVKVRLMNTAEILENVDNPNNTGILTLPYSPRRQGSGLLKVEDAIKVNTIFYTYLAGGERVGSIALKEIDEETDFSLNVEHQLQSDASYEVSAIVLTDGKKSNKLSMDSELVSDAELILNNTDITEETATITLPKGESQLDFSLELSNKTSTDSFIEGFITFTPKDFEGPTVTIPYVGFYGNWDTPNIIDPSEADKDSYTGITGLYDPDFLAIMEKDYESIHKMKQEGKLWGFTQLGRSLFGESFDESKSAISPNGDGDKDRAMPVYTLLRNAKTFEIEVQDDSGNVIKKIFHNTQFEDGTKKIEDYLNDHEHPHDDDHGDHAHDPSVLSLYKAFKYGLVKNVTHYGNWYSRDSKLFSWDGTDENGDIVPEDQYYIVTKATIDYEDAQEQVYKMPVKVDITKPIVTDVKIDLENKKVTFDCEDEDILGYGVFVNNVQLGAVSEKNKSIPTLEEDDEVVILAFDHAGNYSIASNTEDADLSSALFHDMKAVTKDYNKGSTIEVSCFSIVPTKWSITVKNSVGQIMGTTQSDIFSNDLLYKWKPGENDLNGTYTVVFEAELEDGRRASKKFLFNHRQYHVNYDSIETLNDSNVESYIFKRNELPMFVKASAEGLDQSNSYILKLTDPSGQVKFITNPSWTDTDVSWRYVFPSESELGEYTLELFTWDSLEEMNILSREWTKTVKVQ